jgi:hypothetical protein
MMHVDVLHPSNHAHAVYLEPEDGGVNPKTKVRAVFRDGSGVRETSRVFDTLELSRTRRRVPAGCVGRVRLP